MMRFLLTAAAALCLAGAAPPPALTDADRAEIVANAAKLLEDRYVDAALGRRLAAALRREASSWRAISDPAMFARTVSDWLRRASADGHLGLTFVPAGIDDTPGPVTLGEDMERWYGAGVNHGVERIERLPGGVVLLELTVFPPPTMGADVVAAALNVVAQGRVLILDLRNNGGGAETTSLLLGHLLPPGSPLSGGYDRPSETRSHRNSPDWVPGRRFGETKPVYVLVSRKTFSAAEAVAYDLQALKRATIVGERTGGGAHPYEFRRVHRHFALDLPEGKSINPITGGNWQGVGVRPDVEVPAAQALAKALELAAAANPTTAGS